MLESRLEAETNSARSGSSGAQNLRPNQCVHRVVDDKRDAILNQIKSDRNRRGGGTTTRIWRAGKANGAALLQLHQGEPPSSPSEKNLFAALAHRASDRKSSGGQLANPNPEGTEFRSKKWALQMQVNRHWDNSLEAEESQKYGTEFQRFRERLPVLRKALPTIADLDR